MADLTFHILDVVAQDEQVLCEDEEMREVAYESLDEDDSEFEDQSYKRRKKKETSTLGQRTFVIHLFGATVKGEAVRVDVRGFKPFFFLRLPDEAMAKPSQYISALKSYIKKRLGTKDESASDLIELKSSKRKLLFGYTASRDYPFVEVKVPSKALFHKVKGFFLNEHSKPSITMALGAPFTRTYVPKVYEANLDPFLRFMHLRNLRPCGWATVSSPTEEEDGSTGTVTYSCEWEDIQQCMTPPALTAPFKVLSWDIECFSESGEFPMAKNGDPVIQIGCLLTKLGSTDVERFIFTLGGCEAIEGATVYTFKTEKGMLSAWLKWVCEQNIDILIGYNIFGFDEKYVWERCECLGLTQSAYAQDLNRLSALGGQMRLDTKRLSSSAMGDNFLYLWNAAGRLRIDLFHVIKRGYALGSYKLDDTSRYFLSEGVKGIEERDNGTWRIKIGSTKQAVASGRSIVLLNDGGDTLCEKIDIVSVEGNELIIEKPFEIQKDEVDKWAIVKDDVTPQQMFKMQKGSDADRALIAKYCIQDCQLVLDLFRKLDVFNNSMSMANVCSVPVAYIFLRGQGIKIESLMFKYCYENNQTIEVLPQPAFGTASTEEVDSYEGAIVLDPEPGFYTVPVGVADFASLYPSTIISENISHDTLVWVKDYDLSGKLIGISWGSEDFDGLETERYTDIEFDLWGFREDDMRKHKEKVKKGMRVCRYAQNNVGTIPRIVDGLLKARASKRAEIKKESDPFRKALLDSEQLAYKLTANSLYGQLGSGCFKVRHQALAASVTAYGRKQIMFAKSIIEDFYGPGSGNRDCCAESAKIVYGDSVTGDTTIYIRRKNGSPELCRIDELITLQESWRQWHETKEAVDTNDMEIWTERGWTKVQRVIRHKLAPTKKMFRVLTHSGVVDCTEDHSLVAVNGEEIKPSSVSVGTELLHNESLVNEFSNTNETIQEDEAWAMGLFLADGSSDTYVTSSGLKSTWAINKADTSILKTAQDKLPFQTKILDTIESSGVYKLVPFGNIREPANRYRNLFYNNHREKRVPNEILNAPINIVKAFLDGFYTGDGDKIGRDKNGTMRWDQKGKEVCSGLTLLAKRLGYTVSINDRSSKPDVFRMTCTKSKQRRNPNAIKKMYEINRDNIEYVYDLQTDNHHFAVGPGSLVVHNTDSLFIAFHPKNPETGVPLEGQEALEATIRLTEEAGKLVTQVLKPPHDFEFDKVYWPFLIFSKKRYVGHKYEEADHHCLTSMGIALKRRDYAPIVKKIYGGAIHILLTEKNVPKAAEFVKQTAMDLVDGKFGLGPLTISKSLRAEYANPNAIAHKVLADRIAERDPGNAPASGDRIAYIYVQSPPGQKAPDLQGDRIETPAYIRQHGLKPDTMYYIEHQISNPVCQMFSHLLDSLPEAQGLLKGLPSDPVKAQTAREAIAYQILFNRATQRNSSTATRAFLSLLGQVSPSRSELNPLVSPSKRVGGVVTSQQVVTRKQSTLDAMFMDQGLLHARKVTEKAKAKANKTAEAKVKSKSPTS